MAAEEQIFAKQIRAGGRQILPVLIGQRASGPPRLTRQLRGLTAHEGRLFLAQASGEMSSGDARLIEGDQDG